MILFVPLASKLFITVGSLTIALLAFSFGSQAQTYPPNTSLEKVTPPSVDRPGYLNSARHPIYGTDIVRISDQQAFGSDKTVLAHHYAKNQPWNSDGSLIKLHGWPSALLDGRTYQLVKWVNPPGEHHTWANTNPHYIYGVQPTNQLVRFDVRSNTTTVLETFNQYSQVSYGAYEGNMDNQDQYLALQVRKGNNTAVVVYDVAGRQIIASYDGQGVWPNNVSLSQSGKYTMVQWDVYGSGERQGISVHRTSDMAFLRNLHVSGGGHFDYGYNTKGEEVLVGTDNVPGSEALVMIGLADAKKTVLLPEPKMGYNIHVSCRNTQRKGWAYVSHFHAGNNPYADRPYYREVFAVKLDGSGTVQRFTHTFASTQPEYERSAFAVPHRDGSKVMWRSDWGDNNNEAPIYSYVAAMPQATSNVTQMSVRARGLQGTERMALQIGGETVQSWMVSKSFKNYSYTGSETGSVRVAITNDQGVNHDLVVDKLTVDGAVYQAEAQTINTGVWQNGSCGGTKSAWLHCSGYIEFALGNAQARQANRLEKSPTLEQSASRVVVYPNPSADAQFTVQGVAANAQLHLYDLHGRRVSADVQRADQQRLLVQTDLPPGLYLLRVEHPNGSQYQQKVALE